MIRSVKQLQDRAPAVLGFAYPVQETTVLKAAAIVSHARTTRTVRPVPRKVADLSPSPRPPALTVRWP